MSNHLFSEFDPVSSKAWKQQIQADLKGADYNDTLIWQSLEGIHVKPFYHKDDSNNISPIIGQPPSWNVGQTVFIDNAPIVNKLIVDATNRGAEALILQAEKEFDITAVFDAIPFSNTLFYIHLTFLDTTFVNKLHAFLSNKKYNVQYLIDPIHHFASNGNWYQNVSNDLQSLQEIIQNTGHIHINTSLYQNAGATTVQQLAYALAHANEYLNTFNVIHNAIPTFTIACGSNYFFEIAKIRALRKLYAALAKVHDLPQECHIIATPSKRNKTLYDYNVNMLRTTTECMSAILGGANTVCNMPYDALYHKSNEFGERISRNQLLILKEESYFNEVANPSDGSYYIENITQEIAEKALTLFKEIEAHGGFIAQLNEGTIQRKIKESATKEQGLFDDGSITLLGTNKHPNPNDFMKENLELYPFVKQHPRKTNIEPIIEKRLAEIVEQKRLDEEK